MNTEMQKLSDELWEAKRARVRQEMTESRKADVEADMMALDRAVSEQPTS